MKKNTTKLSKNFSKKEFDSKDGAEMPKHVFLNIKRLAKELQILRDYTGLSIKINSGYRSPQHNANVGGVKNSKHVKGMAADIVIKGMKPSDVYSLIEYLIDSGKMNIGGLGKYNTFTHLDIRTKTARWDNT